MFGLLACAAPEVEIAVEPPAAEYAVGVPAADFVGPVDAPACGMDPAKGLRTGVLGWRVIVVGGAVAEVKRWAAADKRWAEVCGEAPTEKVLLAVDGAAPFDETAITRTLTGLGAMRPWLLVADATPGAEVPERKGSGPRPFSTLLRSPSGWTVLTSGGGVPGLEALSAREAAEHVVRQGVTSVVITGGHATWSEMVEGLDALAAAGLRPAWGLTVGDGWERRAEQAAQPASKTRIRLGDTLAVLPLPAASDRGILLQRIGPAVRDDTDPTRVLEDVLGLPAEGRPVEDFGQGF